MDYVVRGLRPGNHASLSSWNSAIATLLQRLVEGPSFLLLGQALDDPVVPGSAACSQLDRTRAQPTQSMTGLMAARPVPGWLSDAADYPWNGVFTSRIDSSLPDVFRRDWRRVVPTAQPQLGRHPRSATELQLRYLFGGLGLPEDERPPADAIAEVESRARAAETLNALADTIITPRGVLVIDGYRPG